MSHSPPRNYSYPPQCYYYEETEYSDSEVSDYPQEQVPVARPVTRKAANPVARTVSHPVHPDIKEIFRRKPSHSHYISEAYLPAEYYYKTVPAYSAPVKKSIPVASPPLPYRVPVLEEHYYPPEIYDDAYDTVVYRSVPHVSCKAAPTKELPSAAANTVKTKKHHVTVRTPRKTSTTNTCKKPSALCLPLAAQPDPANRRTQEKERKIPAETNYTGTQQKSLERHHSLPLKNEEKCLKTPSPRKEGLATLTNTEMESVLDRYEKIVSEYAAFEEKIDDTQTKEKKKPKGIHTTVCAGKPEVSLPSPKLKIDKLPKTEEKQDRALRKGSALPVSKRSHSRSQSHSQTPSSQPSPNSLKTPPAMNSPRNETADILDTMLQELMEKGCENKIVENQTKVEERNNTINSQPDGILCMMGDNVNINDEDIPKSINYQDMQNSITKSSESFQMGDPIAKLSKHIQTQMPSPHRVLEKTSPSVQNQSRTYSPFKCDSEDNNPNALELHRSKSYIVNLIDRALSKELGTTSGEEGINCCNTAYSKERNTEARTVMDMMNRYSTRPDKELPFDVAQAFTDSFLSNNIGPPANEWKETFPCPCFTHGEEPLYIKQLKQLRWGHLKHIQREVRRLTDLEKFLDSCGSSY